MKYLIAVLVLFTTFVSGAVFGALKVRPIEYLSPIPTPTTYPTGKEVLAELNNYRISQGLPELEVSEWLCDNIGERWVNYVENNSHEGLRDFLEQQHPGEYWNVYEILAPGDTPQETVKNWSNSPSHDLAIKNSSKVCVYSARGYSVALLSN